MRGSFACLLLSFALLGTPSLFGDKVALEHVPSEGRIPDLTQTDPKGGFAGGGRSFCGPVAVSNSLMAMFARDLTWNDVTQYDLVNELASRSFMNTDAEKGTSVTQLMRGVDLYLKQRGEKDYYLKFQGWRRHEIRFRTGVNEPRLNWIKSCLTHGGAVWLNIGWYRVEEDGVYKRVGGHWITAVGHGTNPFGDPDPSYLTVHDPAPRAGYDPNPDFVKTERLEGGRLVGTMRNLPRPAKNLYKLTGGMHVKRGMDFALLDGAVALMLKKKTERTAR